MNIASSTCVWVAASFTLAGAEVALGALDLPTVPQPILDVAYQAPLIRYNRNISGGAHTNGAWNEGWQIPTAVAAWQGNTAADAKLLQQINYNLVGTNSFSANGGYPAQHELTMTSTYAILKQSDRFWNNVLTADQRYKIDLAMKATVIASAYTTADKTYQPASGTVTTLDGDTNLNRGWNPNYREGMFGNLIQGMVYFGGVNQVNSILNNYNHSAFQAELQAAGLTNIAQTFNWKVTNPASIAPSASKIENNIKDYRYNSQPLLDPFDLYATLTLNTYNRNVSAGLNNGTGILYNGVYTGVIASGKEGLPNVGELGMLTEFQAVDAGGQRSSITYAYDGFRPNIANHTAVLLGGYWRDGATATEMLRRLDIGITDLVYKLEHGYRNYSHGTGSTTVFNITRADWDWSFRTTIPFWTQVLREYHFGEAITPPGFYTSTSSFQSFALEEEYSEPITVLFSAIPHQNQMDAVFGLLRGEAVNWTDLAAIVRFNTAGNIDVRNGGTYAADLVLPYSAETIYDIRMEIDPILKLYSVFVTPEGGEEVQIASNYAFRSDQALLSSLDHWAIRHVTGSLTVFSVVVPEPVSAGVVALALGGMILGRRKRA